MKIRESLRVVGVVAVLALVCASLSQWSSGVHAQKQEKARSAHPVLPKADSKTNPPASPNNAAYTAKIKENTTESYFMTELVDHLPASDKVPSPDKILGYAVGEPGHLTYTKDLYRYYRELEKATTRVKVFTAPEKSEEGREQLLIAVGDEAAIAETLTEFARLALDDNDFARAARLCGAAARYRNKALPTSISSDEIDRLPQDELRVGAAMTLAGAVAYALDGA